MTTETHLMQVSDLQVEVVRKAIKNLHLGVYPPEGRVRVAVPLTVSDDAVRVAIIGKLRWIHRQQASFRQQARDTARELVSGETWYYLGRAYRLEVNPTEGPGRVALRQGRILELHVKAGLDAPQREEVLKRWYRDRLKERIGPLLEKWQPILGVELAGWHIRQMKTRWGSCTQSARRIWLNLELIKKPPPCLEYLVVHELLHLRVRHHDAQFQALMDRHLPKWQHTREVLNSAPLAYAEWGY